VRLLEVVFVTPDSDRIEYIKVGTEVTHTLVIFYLLCSPLLMHSAALFSADGDVTKVTLFQKIMIQVL